MSWAACVLVAGCFDSTNLQGDADPGVDTGIDSHADTISDSSIDTGVDPIVDTGIDSHIDTTTDSSADVDAELPVMASCADIHAAEPSAPSGVYRIAPAPADTHGVFDAYCDMENDGGGWTLVKSWPNGTCLPIAGWNDSGSALGPGFFDPDALFKLPDRIINTLKRSMYRGQGGATHCLQGACSVSVTVFWGGDCVYSSSTSSTACSTAYLDAALTVKTPSTLMGPSPCLHHWGLTDSHCAPSPWDGTTIASFLSSQLNNSIAVGEVDSSIHASPCRTDSGYPEDGWIKVWVR